jgi:hypothetical protein
MKLRRVGPISFSPRWTHPATSFFLFAIGTALFNGGCGTSKDSVKAVESNPLAMTTKEGRTVAESGFLGDYSQLHTGSAAADDPLLVYYNPEVNCKKYTKIMVDPVKLYAKVGDSSFDKLDPDTRSMLVKMAEDALRKVVTKAGYALVSEPGPNTMRIRAALTEARESDVALKDITAVAPYVSAAAAVWSEAKGRALFTGEAAFEAEVLDSMTGERLFAGVDARVGKLDVRNYKSWQDVQAAIETWAARGIKRLINCREKGSFKLSPEEEGIAGKLNKYVP